tara:strand:+ start:732 stop:1310 length:579 start_codon:yes stop_codon:yes gene_type:complete
MLKNKNYLSPTFIDVYQIEDLKLCDDLIKYYKSHKKEYGMKGLIGSNGVLNKKAKDSTDVFFFNQSQDKTIKKFFKILTACLEDYMKKYQIRNPLFTDTNNKLQYYAPGGGYPEAHYERNVKSAVKRQLVYMLYLNTVKDKGGTEFIFQNVVTPAIKGNLLIWPAEFTHLHRGIISPTEKKYIATGWFEIVG